MRVVSLLAVSMVLLLSINLALAHEQDFSEAKQLVDSGIGCDKLTDEQLEAIGDYYMEQMHPGEAHELMDEMMGGEGSENLRQMHVNMARRLYCKEGTGMGMMAGNMGNMMYSGGMMNMMQSGMMGYGYYGYWGLYSILYTILLIGLVILVFLGIAKLWKSLAGKK